MLIFLCLLKRELQPHPLSMAHPNIIETHKLQNVKGEAFLVERRLQKVLNDKWKSDGVHEAANLLRDIASALAFLGDKQLIHGDIKPDNIGFDDGRYILLDFGICRPITTFSQETTPTGSLRTRSPELIKGDASHTSASDIWALGATVFNALVERFPLFKPKESPPRISKPAERSRFEEVLVERVDKHWDRFVLDQSIPEPMRNILNSMLSRAPEQRPSASELLKEAEQELAAFLRPTDNADRFSPAEQISQLARFILPSPALHHLASAQKQAFEERLVNLKKAKGLTSEERTKLDKVFAMMGISNE